MSIDTSSQQAEPVSLLIENGVREAGGVVEVKHEGPVSEDGTG
jgi:hypothetical protein